MPAFCSDGTWAPVIDQDTQKAEELYKLARESYAAEDRRLHLIADSLGGQNHSKEKGRPTL